MAVQIKCPNCKATLTLGSADRKQVTVKLVQPVKPEKPKREPLDADAGIIARIAGTDDTSEDEPEDDADDGTDADADDDDDGPDNADDK